MEATILNKSKQYERTCPNCHANFMANNAKRKYCSDSCRVAYYRAGQAQTMTEQQETLQQQVMELNELKAAPVTRTEAVRVVNPDWLRAQQVYEVQQEQCNRLKAELAMLGQDEQDLLGSNQGASIGMAAGVVGVLIWMAYCYDNRRQQPLGMVFVVVSFVLLVTMGTVGYWLGQGVHQRLVTNDEQAASQLATLTKRRDELSTQLKFESTKLEQLRLSRGDVPQYLSVTETRVDEIRVAVDVVR